MVVGTRLFKWCTSKDCVHIIWWLWSHFMCQHSQISCNYQSSNCVSCWGCNCKIYRLHNLECYLLNGDYVDIHIECTPLLLFVLCSQVKRKITKLNDIKTILNLDWLGSLHASSSSFKSRFTVVLMKRCLKATKNPYNKL